MPEVKLLSATDVQNVLAMEGAIDILEKAFADFAEGNVVMPVRTPIKNPAANGLALFMPAFIPGLDALGAKVVTVYPDNPAKHSLPNVLGTIILLDPETGAPICVMEAGYLTAMRTGAVSGLATKYLARENASVHTLVGTGVQGRTQAWAVATARKLEKCFVYSIDPPDKQKVFAAAIAELTGVPTEVADSLEQAIGKSDIVTFATSAHQPVVNGDWFKEGTHINGIGSHAPGVRELDSKTIARSKVVCDSLEACKAEAGDLQIPVEEGVWNWESVRGELGDVVAGKIQGRQSAEEITLFKSVGLALQDMATASYVLTQARQKGLGTDFSF